MVKLWLKLIKPLTGTGAGQPDCQTLCNHRLHLALLCHLLCFRERIGMKSALLYYLLCFRRRIRMRSALLYYLLFFRKRNKMKVALLYHLLFSGGGTG